MSHREEVADLMAENGRLRTEVNRLREVLAWYGENARLARMIHSIDGEAGRAALSALAYDGGKRACDALAQN